jgi:glutathione S-transferase
MLEATPVPDKRERWRTLIGEGYSQKEIDDAVESVFHVFGRAEEELGKRGPWLAGKTFSLGDINMLAIVHRTFELLPERLTKNALPRLLDWWERAMARPAAKFVYSEDTDEVPDRPNGQSVAGITEFKVAS